MTQRVLVLMLLVLVLAIPLALFRVDAGDRPDFQRLDALLVERGKAFRPESSLPVKVWSASFGKAGDLQGFHGERGFKDLTVAGGKLTATLTDADNLLVGDVGTLQAADATGVVLRLKVAKSSTYSWLVWAGTGEPIDRSRGMTFRADPGSRFRWYYVPVEDSAAWKGSLNRIGLTIGAEASDLPCTVEIDEIHVVRASALARRSLEGRDARIDRAEIAGESRAVLYSPAPGLREATVQVPQNGVLSFGFGMLPSCWFKSGNGVTFRVSVIELETGKPVLLFSQYVDPKAQPADRRWFDATVSLAAFSGRTVEFKFETLEGAPDQSGDGQFDEAVWSSPVLSAPRRGELPNVVVVLLDTVRADHLSLYGYRRGTSPKLEAIANESFVFEHAYSAAPETIESVMSIFTSQFTTSHGVKSFSDRLSSATPTLAGELSLAGFHTMGITEGGSVASEFGFDQGFDAYLDMTKTDAQPTRPNKYIERTFERARTFLRDIGDRRFFLFLHTYEPHTPYAPPMTPDRNYDPDYRGTLGNSVSWQEVEKRLHDKTLAPATPDARHIEALYDGSLQYTDEWLGKLVDELRARGLLDHTILVVTSDHGEDFFDHLAIATHGHSLYEELIHVPLVVRMPRGAAAASAAATPVGARRIDVPISDIDLFPTILDALGLSAPAGVQGQSFLPLLRGERMPPRPVCAEDQTFFVRYSVRVGNEKLIESPGIEQDPKTTEAFAHENLRLDRFKGILKVHELYDLSGDPHEMTNLLSEGRSASPETERQLRRFIARLARSRPYGATTTLMCEQTRMQLEALGYLSGPRRPR